MENKFQIFGSKSSIDLDVMVFVDEITIKPNLSHELEIEFNKQIKLITGTDKEVNSNLCVINNDGIIIDVFKGSIDEVNNSMYYTYDNHINIQHYPNQIKSLLKRDVELKILRTLRVLLSLISRTEYRTIVKSSLTKNYADKIKTLKFCDISGLNIDNYLNKNVRFEDFIKVYAFQLGQTMGLIEGLELYTKNDIIKYNQLLKPFIYRNVKDSNMTILNDIKNNFLDIIMKMEIKNDFEYKYKTLN